MNIPHVIGRSFVCHATELEASFLATNPMTLHFVFQSPLSSHQRESLQIFLESFFSKWQAHGKPLVVRGLLSFNQLLTVLVDESKVPASGCSKDALFKAVNQWCEDRGLTLASRAMIPVVQEESIRLIEWKDCKKLPGSTLVVDVSAARWSTFISGFKVPANQTPLGRLFN
jgi:hypothetical protein